MCVCDERWGWGLIRKDESRWYVQYKIPTSVGKANSNSIFTECVNGV